MKTRILLAALVTALAFGAGTWTPSPASGADDDEAALTSRTKDFVAAWAKHDPKAMAAFWAEDGDLLNPWGRWAKGRGEVEKLFEDEQTGQGPLRESTFEVKADTVRFPGPDVAVQDWDVVITGAYGPDGKKAGAQGFHVTVVSVKTGGSWLTFSARPYVKPPPLPETGPATGPTSR